MAWAEKNAGLAAEKQQRIARAGIEIAGRMGIPGVKYALDVNGILWRPAEDAAAAVNWGRAAGCG